ncbi:MAG: hypothetical protein A3I61_13860 [Acidobacteria bacterium RIFCSPLOWO2_02_FULL_68_18]|nr:MAG: hypothetical protein A3I61_13860 [Acidobacteria bacterium RIFCSPLOWO2_02_FULL_68_18]OFW50758.1 MAG: hypothetical protein A3G77_17640 [Acidobacteria bacterium RIFCSPLOWO2_12_FULL_68_19]
MPLSGPAPSRRSAGGPKPGKRVQTRLREPALSESLLADLPGYVYRVANDPDYTPIFISAGVTAITGYSVDEYLVTRTISCGKEILPEDAERVWQEVQAALEVRRPFEAEYRIRTKAGETRWMWERGRGVYSAGGALLYLEGFVTDVTARVAAEAAVRANERRYERLLEYAPDATLAFDRAGRTLRANAQAVRLFGYSREELLALAVEDLLPARYRDAHRCHRAGYVDDPHAWPMAEGRELWGLRKDGTEFPCEISLNYDDSGDGLIVLVAIRDMTVRRQADAALLEARDRLRRAVEAGNVGLWERDLRTNQVEVSPECKRQLGYADDEVADDYREWHRHVHPDDLAGLRQIQTAYLDGTAPHCEARFRVRHKDGSYRQMLTRYTAERGEDGTPIKLRGANIDITEYTALQAQFLQAQKMESIGRLAGGVAHDFNNLLTVINGIADAALAHIRTQDPLHADIAQIRAAGERAAGLTRQLLAFSRRQILRSEVLDLNAVVVGMADILRRLIGEHIDLRYTLAERLGGVRADRTQLEQVILNLVVNARDAMPHGGAIVVETRDIDVDEGAAALHPSMEAGPYVMLAITDTGVGMDEATQLRVFEPFFTTKASAESTGLGLATVYGIVKQSGGSIWVYSEPGRGATFKIYLPRADAAPAAPSPVAKEVPAARGETILLVEDDTAVRHLARRFLESSGYVVLEAEHGGAALLTLERFNGTVDLLLTDVVMPGMSGPELAARLSGLRPGMKVLYASGYTDDAVLRRGVREDSARLLTKPYTRAELVRRVREVIDT